MDTRKIKNLLRRYRQGLTSQHENDAVEQWLGHLKNDDPTYFDEDTINAYLANAKAVIDSQIKEPVNIFKNNLGKLGVAASLILISGTAIAIWFWSQKNIDKTPALQACKVQPNVVIRKSNGWIYLQTKKAVKYTATLSDGSVIVLNASSRLRYPERFINHKRPVYLEEGEALFTVAKDKTSPFTVYTTKFATTALGTAFNIRNYKNEHKISISLIHGKIRVDNMVKAKSQAASRIVLPHQQIIANDDLTNVKSSSFDDETTVTGWKDGILSFKDASMPEVLNSIENRFNLKITNNSKQVKWSYTGVFKKESLADVLETICLTERIHYKTNNNEIILY
ncbi:FecR family protein [Mucilaginibacter pineti]|uniref:FecR family protein n=1 Tax=Mucilaginibacter pineti TaxID=1391627 RepID=A0A1G7FXE5_9SPHI|nr:FecR family protein [Mucilaginibacter pineti]SDE80574.1 FecR family protein [Mucilaginibacter pineti]